MVRLVLCRLYCVSAKIHPSRQPLTTVCDTQMHKLQVVQTVIDA